MHLVRMLQDATLSPPGCANGKKFAKAGDLVAFDDLARAQRMIDAGQAVPHEAVEAEAETKASSKKSR